MTDRELLDMAAKAAGLPVLFGGPWGVCGYSDDGTGRMGSWVNWNPLTDDGDALRLAVKLGMALDRTSNRCWAHAAGMAINGVCEEFYKDDPYAATRRVIVRVAASIGEQHGS